MAEITEITLPDLIRKVGADKRFLVFGDTSHTDIEKDNAFFSLESLYALNDVGVKVIGLEVARESPQGAVLLKYLKNELTDKQLASELIRTEENDWLTREQNAEQNTQLAKYIIEANQLGMWVLPVDTEPERQLTMENPDMATLYALSINPEKKDEYIAQVEAFAKAQGKDVASIYKEVELFDDKLYRVSLSDDEKVGNELSEIEKRYGKMALYFGDAHLDRQIGDMDAPFGKDSIRIVLYGSVDAATQSRHDVNELVPGARSDVPDYIWIAPGAALRMQQDKDLTAQCIEAKDRAGLYLYCASPDADPMLSPPIEPNNDDLGQLPPPLPQQVPSEAGQHQK